MVLRVLTFRSEHALALQKKLENCLRAGCNHQSYGEDGRKQVVLWAPREREVEGSSQLVSYQAQCHLVFASWKSFLPNHWMEGIGPFATKEGRTEVEDLD